MANLKSMDENNIELIFNTGEKGVFILAFWDDYGVSLAQDFEKQVKAGGLPNYRRSQPYFDGSNHLIGKQFYFDKTTALLPVKNWLNRNKLTANERSIFDSDNDNSTA